MYNHTKSDTKILGSDTVSSPVDVIAVPSYSLFANSNPLISTSSLSTTVNVITAFLSL